MYHREILLLYLATHTIPYKVMAKTLRSLADEYEGKKDNVTDVKKRYPKNVIGRLGDKSE
jgi:hypothetical protein